MKKSAKLIAAAFSASLLILSMIPFSASAEAVISGDYSYEVQGGDVVILNYNGEDENIVIPAELDGKKVTQIGANAFDMEGDLISVEIPDGVTKIADSAFAIDKRLETVTIPATVKEIGVKAFQQCEALKTINFAGDETAWNAITIAEGNESLTNNKPNYNASLTAQSGDSSESSSSEASSSESSSSEASSSESSSSEASSSESSSSEASSSESSSSEASSSESTSSASTTASAATTESTIGAEAVPQSSGVNIAYVIGGILVGIAVLDLIYFSIKKPQPQENTDDPTK